MRIVGRACLGLACGLGIASAAAAQSDFTTAVKISCVVVSATLCTAPGKCTTSLASDNDKRNVFTIDFAAKTASVSHSRTRGNIVEDKIVDGARQVVMSPEGTDDRIRMTLNKDGKLTVDTNNGQTADFTCAAAS